MRMKSSFVLVAVCLTLAHVGRVNSNLLNLVKPVTDKPDVVVEKWQNMDKQFRNIVDMVLKQVIPMVVRAQSEVELSSECQGALFKLILAVRQMQPWAIHMLDAMGKMPSGLLSGTVSDLGAYDQCLGITVTKDYPVGEEAFRGQYCSVEIRPPLPKKNKKYRFSEIIHPLTNLSNLNPVVSFVRTQAQFFYFISMRIGACVPSVCSKQDMTNIGGMIQTMTGLYTTIGRCEIREKFIIDNDQIAMICIVVGLILLCAVGTTLDVLPDYYKSANENGKPKESAWRTALTSFSVRKNVTTLMNTDTSKDSIPVLHGLKFISITWIIVGHTYLYLNWQLLRSLTKAQGIVSSFAFQAIANAFVAVDSFFFASGILVSFLTITYVDKRGPKAFNIPIFIIKRFWRFIPSTGMLVGLTILLPLFGSGPLWHESIDVLVNNCRKNWWANMLFINNFLYSPDTCQGTTWYTACDVQLYFLSIIYLLLVYKDVKVSYFMLVFFILGSLTSTVAVNYWQDLPPALLMSSPDPEGIFDYWYYAHFLPHVHLGPYAIGLALGYILARHRDIELKKWIKIAGWICAFICNMLVLYATYFWNDTYKPALWEALVYSGLHRPCWILGVAWMVYACTTGFGGVINTILSWRGFVPLSRLTFLAYLWHGTIIWVYLGNLEGGLETNHMVIVWMFLGHVMVTYALSFVFYCLYEAPFNRLEKLVLGRFMGPPPAKKTGLEDAPIETKDKLRMRASSANGGSGSGKIREATNGRMNTYRNGNSLNGPAGQAPASSEFLNETYSCKL